MITYAKITVLYERLSIGDEQRGGEDSSSIKSQKTQLEQYAKQHGFANIRHYTDDDESGRFFDRTGYSEMMEDVESGKVGIVIMKDLTRWERDHVQVGIAMETFRQNDVRLIAINDDTNNYGIRATNYNLSDPYTISFTQGEARVEKAPVSLRAGTYRVGFYLTHYGRLVVT